MAKKKKKKAQSIPFPICPYCHSPARLVPASDIIKKDSVEYVWVCSKYPVCDSYVAAHNNSKSHMPMGPLANAELRKLRFEAHCKFDQIWKTGIMSKDDAYCWLAESLSLKFKHAHIGKFAEYHCLETIRLAEKVLNNNNKS